MVNMFVRPTGLPHQRCHIDCPEFFPTVESRDDIAEAEAPEDEDEEQPPLPGFNTTMYNGWKLSYRKDENTEFCLLPVVGEKLKRKMDGMVMFLEGKDEGRRHKTTTEIENKSDEWVCRKNEKTRTQRKTFNELFFKAAATNKKPEAK